MLWFFYPLLRKSPKLTEQELETRKIKVIQETEEKKNQFFHVI